MRKTKTNRGFTLMELTIVMALVAIIAVMIASFTSLTSLRTKQAGQRTEFMDAVTAYRTRVTDGFAAMDKPQSEGFFYAANADGLTIGAEDFPLPDEIDRVTADTNGTLLRITVTNEALSQETACLLIYFFTEGCILTTEISPNNKPEEAVVSSSE